MSSKSLFIAFCLLFIRMAGSGRSESFQNYYLLNESCEKIDSVIIFGSSNQVQNKERPNPLLNLFKSKQKKNKRITAAILAFPLPFGIVGLHRIYLGTAPYVPVVYIATAGGVLGIMPFIDFCMLIMDKDEKKYTENKKVFMWLN